MKQFQAAYQDRDSFRSAVTEWKAWREAHASGQALVHIFSDDADDADVRIVRDIVEELLPDAAYLGASASGNIYEGNITTEKLVVTCTVFEHVDSFAFTRLFSIENRDASSFRSALRDMKDDFTGVKAVEVIMTIDTIVEGAETDEVVRILEDMHCDYIQGFHFSRPLPEEAFIRFIGEQNGRRTDNCGANSPRIYCSPN